MAPVLRAALVLCVMLAAAHFAQAQYQRQCYSDVSNCLTTMMFSMQDQRSLPDRCRKVEEYWTCVTSITSCGSHFGEELRPYIERARAMLLVFGCSSNRLPFESGQPSNDKINVL